MTSSCTSLPPPSRLRLAQVSKTGHGIEVGAEGLAADAGSLEGNGAATAEAIAHARSVTEGALAELLDEFGQTVWRWCRGAR